MRTITGVKRRGSNLGTGIIKNELTLKYKLKLNSDIKGSNQIRVYSINKGTKV